MAVIGNFPSGGGGGEFLKIWGEKNGELGVSESVILSTDEDVGCKLLMPDGTVLCSSKLHSNQGVWTVSGIERNMLTGTGYAYDSMVEVPGGCIIGSYYSGWAGYDSPVYFYDTKAKTLTDLKVSFSNQTGYFPDYSIPFGSGALVMMRYRQDGGGGYYRLFSFDAQTRAFVSLRDIHGLQNEFLAYTPTGVLIRSDNTVDRPFVLHVHPEKGVAFFETGYTGEPYFIYGEVPPNLILSSAFYNHTVGLDYVNNKFTRFNQTKALYSPICETRDYIWGTDADGIVRTSKTSGKNEVMINVRFYNSADLPHYYAHEVEGGWLVLPRAYNQTGIYFIDNAAQTIHTMLADAKGSGNYPIDVWRLSDGRYVTKSRTTSPMYICNISAKQARKLAGTDYFRCALQTDDIYFVAIDTSAKRLSDYNVKTEKAGSGEQAVDTDAQYVTRATNPAYIIFVTADRIMLYDASTGRQMSLAVFDTYDDSYVYDIFKRKNYLLIRIRTSSSNLDKDITYILNLTTLETFDVSGTYGIPYGERECERIKY